MFLNLSKKRNLIRFILVKTLSKTFTCEMCGTEIYGRTIEIKIEGAVLAVCGSCAKHGKRVNSRPKKITGPTAQVRAVSKPKSPTPRTTSSTPYRGSMGGGTGELVSDYTERIRLARQKMKLTQKEVSIQTKISTAVLQSIEIGKVRPTDDLRKRIEKFFNIKLTEEVVRPSAQEMKKGTHIQTLGDIVVIKKKSEEKE